MRLLLALAFALPLGAAAQGDTSPPEVVYASVSPDTVRVEPSANSVTVTVVAVDDVSGLHDVATVWLVGPDNAFFGLPAPVVAESDSGTVYRVTQGFTRESALGDWALDLVTVRDNAGRSTTLRAGDLAALGFDPYYHVTADYRTAALVSFDLPLAEVSTAAGSPTVPFVIAARAGTSPVRSVSVVFERPDGVPRSGSAYEPTSGDRQSGSWEGELRLTSSDPPGTWPVTRVEVRDQAGGRRAVDRDELEALGYPLAVTVTDAPVSTERPPPTAGPCASPNPTLRGRPVDLAPGALVSDVLGRLVAAADRRGRLDTAGLAPGLYTATTDGPDACTFTIAR